jgi:hypothetical protein
MHVIRAEQEQKRLLSPHPLRPPAPAASVDSTE